MSPVMRDDISPVHIWSPSHHHLYLLLITMYIYKGLLPICLYQIHSIITLSGPCHESRITAVQHYSQLTLIISLPLYNCYYPSHTFSPSITPTLSLYLQEQSTLISVGSMRKCTQHTVKWLVTEKTYSYCH